MKVDDQHNTPLEKRDAVPPEEDGATEVEEKEDIITVEINNLNAMLDSKCEFREVLSQIYKVMMVLHRLGCREDKIYALDKELEMEVQIKKVKNSYNSLGVMIITIISGGLQVIGGAVGIFAAFPGTAAGNALGKIMPFFLKGEEAIKKINGVSSAISGIGQGTGAVGKIFDNKDEAQRAVLQFYLQQMQRKHEDRNRSSSEERQNLKEAVRNLQAAESEAHQAASRLIDTR